MWAFDRNSIKLSYNKIEANGIYQIYIIVNNSVCLYTDRKQKLFTYTNSHLMYI